MDGMNPYFMDDFCKQEDQKGQGYKQDGIFNGTHGLLITVNGDEQFNPEWWIINTVLVSCPSLGIISVEIQYVPFSTETGFIDFPRIWQKRADKAGSGPVRCYFYFWILNQCEWSSHLIFSYQESLSQATYLHEQYAPVQTAGPTNQDRWNQL